MKVKVIFNISRLVMIIALGFMAINFILYSFPDVLVRLVGIILLVDLMLLSYSTVSVHKNTD
ncbi:hypothetical protein [[Clostridium] fimetarium]|uniref:Uncharacterized protein n=1 Tax=[Clostridium] fimetarium TaxID=99656 RepID=A0A1I0P7I2_9FIRM|nr:hypothetical protein [[Clostridium] fimetarium]SEW10345.1 hypothetical protein SAMN05421659_104231 [[Clostridium] fimetarium]